MTILHEVESRLARSNQVFALFYRRWLRLHVLAIVAPLGISRLG